MALRIAVASCLATGAWAHGTLVIPLARQPGAPTLENPDRCANMSCVWFSNNMEIPGNATICDPKIITSNPGVAPCSGPKDTTWRLKMPWRAPGTAPILSPCGVHGGTFKGTPEDCFKVNDCGANGKDLPVRTSALKWVRGKAAEVAFTVEANHGGGYAYRLCPADAPVTEECFQAHHLSFEGNTTTAHFVNGTKIEIPAVRTTQGTIPAGSQWTRNPVPTNDEFPKPFPTDRNGWGWNWALVDRVMIPAALPLGKYLVSWRWDCELSIEAWSNCGDVEIVDAPGPAVLV